MNNIVWVGSLCALLAGCAGSSDKSDDDPGTTPVHTGTHSEALPVVVINEFMASNASSYTDEAGAYPDWIELYNTESEEADLSGWWLTDDTEDIFNWQFPEGFVIPANGYVIIFADDDTEEGDAHAGFNLAAEGEDIGLYGPNVMDNPEVDAVEDYSPQATDISLARMPDAGSTWEEDSTPTPGGSNQ